MIRKADIYYGETLAGLLERTDSGYRFTYNDKYLLDKASMPISLTLPISLDPYNSNILFPFFDGLIPEGWLLGIATDYWKLKAKDRFELLATLCRDTIGAVTVIGREDENE